MNEKKLKELIEFAKTTDLQEIAWEKKNFSVHFRRSPLPTTEALSTHSTPSTESPIVQTGPIDEPTLIRSTMVGTFYRSDASGKIPFVVEGAVVKTSQPVAAIEAMKIMKDVLAPGPCKILKVLVTNGHAVEYGQPLFEIEPYELQVENV